MSQTQDIRIEWTTPFTIADQFRIDALDDDMRAAVERYAKAYVSLSRSPTEEEVEDDLDKLEESDADSIASEVSANIEFEISSAIRSAIVRRKRRKEIGK